MSANNQYTSFGVMSIPDQSK